MSDDQKRLGLTLRLAAKLVRRRAQKLPTAGPHAGSWLSGAKPRSKGEVQIAVLVLAALALTFAEATKPLFLLNASPSVPIGVYWLDAPLAGDLAAIRLPEPVLSLADARGYLPAAALLIKRVATRTADLVCRFGGTVTINGRFVAAARARDRSGRPMPRWTGCSPVAAD